MDLINIIDEQIEDIEEIKEESWAIKDDSQADWWIESNNEEIRKKSRLADNIKNKIMFYENQLKLVEKEIKGIESFKVFKLEEYFRSLDDKELTETKTGNQKKYELPSGTLIIKKQSPAYKTNDEIMLKWLKERDMNEYIKVSEKPQWGELKKATITKDGIVVTVDGEVVEGVEVVEREDKFEIKER